MVSKFVFQESSVDSAVTFMVDKVCYKWAIVNPTC